MARPESPGPAPYVESPRHKEGRTSNPGRRRAPPPLPRSPIRAFGARSCGALFDRTPFDHGGVAAVAKITVILMRADFDQHPPAALTFSARRQIGDGSSAFDVWQC